MAGVGIGIVLTLIVQRVQVAQKEEGSHPSSLREEGDKEEIGVTMPGIYCAHEICSVRAEDTGWVRGHWLQLPGWVAPIASQLWTFIPEHKTFSLQTDKGRNPVTLHRVPEGLCSSGAGQGGGSRGLCCQN